MWTCFNWAVLSHNVSYKPILYYFTLPNVRLLGINGYQTIKPLSRQHGYLPMCLIINLLSLKMPCTFILIKGNVLGINGLVTLSFSFYHIP